MNVHGVALAALVALLGWGCSDDDGAPGCEPECRAGEVCLSGSCVAEGELDAGAEGVDAGSPGGDAGDVPLGDGGVPPLEAFCRGEGPLLAVGDDGTVTEEDCAGRIAAGTFRYAICACDGVVTSSALSTDSLDSTTGTSGGSGGSVGTNAGGNSTAPWSVGGSLWSSGESGWTVSADLFVGSELHLAGRLAGSETEVTRDAWIGGGVGIDTLRVGGALTVPEGVDLNAATLETGSVVRDEVAVPEPCACDEDELVDVAGFLSRFADTNENGLIDLDAAALANVTEPTELTLPCGRYYLDEISATAPVTIRVEGRVALFIGGSLTANDDFVVELGDDAEVDVFLGGTITAAGALSFGSADAPARARVYVGGVGTVNLAASTTFAGNLYAPRAELVTSGDAEVFGALFTRRISASGMLTVHYDTAILEAGDECEPPEVCAECGDCGSGYACVEGECGECGSSDDCCAPLICSGGRCVPELI